MWFPRTLVGQLVALSTDALDVTHPRRAAGLGMEAFFVTRSIQMPSPHRLRHLERHRQRWPESIGSSSGSRLRADGGPVRLSVRVASMALLVILFVSGSGNGQEEHLQSQSLLTGYKRYNATCSHCHGPDGVGGSFAPSLVSRAPDLTNFRAVVADGIGSKMPGYRDDLNVAPYIDDIQRYLQARAEGRTGRGRPKR
jgi:mono/diheme cytochrome c family protein